MTTARKEVLIDEEAVSHAVSDEHTSTEMTTNQVKTTIIGNSGLKIDLFN